MASGDLLVAEHAEAIRADCGQDTSAATGLLPPRLPPPAFYITGFSSFPGVPANPTESLIEHLRHLHEETEHCSSGEGQGGDGSKGRPANYHLCSADVLRVSALEARDHVAKIFANLSEQHQPQGADGNHVAALEAALLVPAAGGTCRCGHPTLMLHLGVDERADCFKLERCAYNNVSFRVPDVDGYQPQGECISGRLPLGLALATDLPLRRLRHRLAGECAPAAVHISDDAGRYLCNMIYFLSLHQISEYSSSSGVDGPSGVAHAASSGNCGNVHALFLHVPPFSVVDEQRQLQFLLALLEELAQILAGELTLHEKAEEAEVAADVQPSCPLLPQRPATSWPWQRLAAAVGCRTH